MFIEPGTGFYPPGIGNLRRINFRPLNKMKAAPCGDFLLSLPTGALGLFAHLTNDL
jgi:hypothetical protein